MPAKGCMAAERECGSQEGSQRSRGIKAAKEGVWRPRGSTATESACSSGWRCGGHNGQMRVHSRECGAKVANWGSGRGGGGVVDTVADGWWLGSTGEAQSATPVWACAHAH